MSTSPQKTDGNPTFSRNFHWDRGSTGRSSHSSSEPSTSSGHQSLEPNFLMNIDWPVSVLDQLQAVRDHQQFPTNDRLLLGRIFGAPGYSDAPCRTCCGLNVHINKTYWHSKDKSVKKTYLGYTEEEYENMRDTCPAHYVNTVLEEQRKAEEAAKAQKDRERARELRLLNAAEKRREKKEKEQAKKRAAAAAAKKTATPSAPAKRAASTAVSSARAKRAASTPSGPTPAKTKAKGKRLIESESGSDNEDDDEIADEFDDEPGPAPPPSKKKRTVWNCPLCNRSARYGSCGCTQCDEWYHLKCLKIQTKDVPKVWVCDPCKRSGY